MLITQETIQLLARVLLAAMFAVSAIGNVLGGFPSSVQYVASKQLPAPTMLAALGLLIKIVGSVSLISGKYMHLTVPLLLVFLVTVTVIFNNPLSDPSKKWMFFSLLGNMGGLLLLL